MATPEPTGLYSASVGVTKVYDISTATNAVYTNSDHSKFSVMVDGVLMEGKAVAGLILFDGLMQYAIPIADYVPSERKSR